jgi:hypothetical protein
MRNFEEDEVMQNSKLTDQWKVDKIEQLKEIHAFVLLVFTFCRNIESHQYPLDLSKGYFNNLFDLSLTAPKDHPFAFSDKRLILIRKEYSFKDIYYGGLLSYECVYLTHIFIKRLEGEKDMTLFRQETETLINALHRGAGCYAGYQFASYDTKNVAREQKKMSGKGQRLAMEKRVNALLEKIDPLIKGHELKIDKGEFYKQLSRLFNGAEDYPRDSKTVTGYKKAIEGKKNIKIVWDKGTFIPE